MQLGIGRKRKIVATTTTMPFFRSKKSPHLPDGGELAAMFEALLDELKIPDARRAQMLKLPKQTKLKMLSNHHQVVATTTQSPSATMQSAGALSAQLAQLLQEFEDWAAEEDALHPCPVAPDKLVDMRLVAASYAPDASWAAEFQELDGLGLIVSMLSLIAESQAEGDIVAQLHRECVAFLKTLLNTRLFLDEFTGDDQLIFGLTLSIESADPIVRRGASRSFSSPPSTRLMDTTSSTPLSRSFGYFARSQ